MYRLPMIFGAPICWLEAKNGGCTHGFGLRFSQSDAVGFAVTVTDFSVLPKLLDSDIVFVRKQPVARNGQMVVVRINGQEGVIKYFHKKSDMVILTSENP